jgi:HEAT repeat protein|tara:strand:+ start:2206 stop:2550 length:345 start_codon:yes stop_codon:yes gene_type:complete
MALNSEEKTIDQEIKDYALDNRSFEVLDKMKINHDKKILKLQAVIEDEDWYLQKQKRKYMQANPALTKEQALILANQQLQGLKDLIVKVTKVSSLVDQEKTFRTDKKVTREVID